MVVMSLLRVTRPQLGNASLFLRSFGTSGKKAGGHGPNTMQIIPSRYQWDKFKDDLHFYIMLGVIPLSLFTFYMYVFVGPSTLAEIPEGYVPEDYEYYKNPVTRLIVKHFTPKQQQVYERNIFYFVEHEEKRRMRLLASKVDRLMAERGDYPNYYASQNTESKYVRNMALQRERMEREYPGEDD